MRKEAEIERDNNHYKRNTAVYAVVLLATTLNLGNLLAQHTSKMGKGQKEVAEEQHRAHREKIGFRFIGARVDHISYVLVYFENQ